MKSRLTPPSLLCAGERDTSGGGGSARVRAGVATARRTRGVEVVERKRDG